VRSPVRHHLWRRPWTISPIVGYFLLGTTSSSPLTMFGKKIEYEVESSRKKKKHLTVTLTLSRISAMMKPTTN